MTVVLDASVTLAWAFGDPGLDAGALLERVALKSAIVPGLWRLEVGNAVLRHERRGAIRQDQAEELLRRIGALPIRVDHETDGRAWEPTMTLARRHRLTLNDAAYLELAVRLGAGLATFDQDLAKAAAADEGLPV